MGNDKGDERHGDAAQKSHRILSSALSHAVVLPVLIRIRELGVGIVG